MTESTYRLSGRLFLRMLLCAERQFAIRIRIGRDEKVEMETGCLSEIRRPCNQRGAEKVYEVKICDRSNAVNEILFGVCMFFVCSAKCIIFSTPYAKPELDPRGGQILIKNEFFSVLYKNQVL